MKTTIHVKTGDFEFIEMEYDRFFTPEEASEHYDALRRLHTPPGEGISQKEENDTLDRYLIEGTGELDVYLRMNEKQKYMFQALKRSFKRMKAREVEHYE